MHLPGAPGLEDTAFPVRKVEPEQSLLQVTFLRRCLSARPNCKNTHCAFGGEIMVSLEMAKNRQETGLWDRPIFLRRMMELVGLSLGMGEYSSATYGCKARGVCER